MKREVNEMKIEKDFKVFFADIWATKAEPTAPDGTKLPRVENPKDVVILLTDKEPIDEEYSDLFVAPISTETELACNRDLLLSADENPLKQPIMIELWNSQPMLKQNLSELRGYLKKEQADWLKRLHLSLYEGGIQISDVPTGKPIESEDDTRVDFHKREIEETLYLRLPVQQLIEMRSQENAETVAKWQEDKTECGEHSEIILPSEQIRRIRNWTRKAILLPEYASQLRENEIALAAFMEALLDYQLETEPENFDLEARFKVKPLIRFDVAPNRSTLFDLAMVSINGWWVDVRPVSTKSDGFVQIDRRIFDSPFAADYYIPVPLEKSKDGGLEAKIPGYLAHEDIEQLKLGCDKYRYSVDLEHFLPMRELWQKIAEKRATVRDWVRLGEAIDFQTLDLELPVVDFPDAVYLRMLSSKEDAKQYIREKKQWEAEIEVWQTKQIRIAEILEEISPVDLFKDLIAKVRRVVEAGREMVEKVLHLSRKPLAPAFLAPARQFDGMMAGRMGASVIDLETGKLIKEAMSEVVYNGEESELYISELPEHLSGRKFRVLFFDNEEIGGQVRELFLQSGLLELDEQNLTVNLADTGEKELSALLEQIGSVVPQYSDIPTDGDTVDEFGSITLTLHLPKEARGLPEDRFLVMIL